MGGVPRRRRRRVRLFLVLRSLPGLGRPAEADDAPGPCRRREAVRRFRRPHRRGGRRPITGEIIPVQIFVAVLGASSFTYAEAVWSQKLPDWIAAHVRAFAYFGGAARQTVSDNLKAGITKASLPRADGQPDLRRHGAALRHRDCSGAALQAARQSQSRGRRPGRRALDSGAACGTGASSRWPSSMPRSARLLDDLNDRADARLGHQPAGAVRAARSTRARSPCRRALRICRVEALPGRPRLPRRDRQALLQRAAPADPPGGRGADHRRDSRDLPSRQAGRQPSPQPAPASADDRRRAHAQLAPALSRLDP